MIPVRRVQRFIRNSAWAILPDKLEEIDELVQAHLSGVRLSHPEILERIGSAGSERRARTGGGVAIIPLYGVLTQRANVMTDISGGTSTQKTAALLRAAVADSGVGTIVLDIDSPGGETYGTGELADELHAATKKKPVVAVANSLAASAAYWIGSQATEFVSTPGAEVGSIGVVAVHQEASRLLDAGGVTTTVVRAGRHKWEANEYEPLNADAREALQKRVDDAYSSFVRAVARGRNVTQRQVREEYGEGRIFGSSDALRIGMIDRIATLDQVLAELQSGSGLSRSTRAVSAVGATETRRDQLVPLAVHRRQLELLEADLTEGPQ